MRSAARATWRPERSAKNGAFYEWAGQRPKLPTSSGRGRAVETPPPSSPLVTGLVAGI